MECCIPTPGRCAWWLVVLWSVTARKSSPALAPSAASPEMLSRPSEWRVWAWKSPANQRRPAGAGRFLVLPRGTPVTGAASGP